MAAAIPTGGCLNLEDISTEAELIEFLTKTTNSVVTELHLTSEQCHMLARENMAEMLKLLTSHLTSLDVLQLDGRLHGSQHISEEELDVGLKILAASSTVRTLVWTDSGLGNFDYSMEEGPFATHVMHLTSLTSLDLSGNGKLTCYDLLGQVLSRNSSLTYLIFGGRGIGDEIGRALCNTTSLQTLDLRCSDLTLQDCSTFLQGIMNNSSLHTLLLDANEHITDEGLHGLVCGLCQHPGLRNLELGHYNIGEASCEALGMLVERSSVLQQLWLPQCVGGKSWERLGLALGKNNSLRVLNLNSCTMAKNDYKAIGQGLMENTTLETLDLTYTRNHENTDGTPALPIFKALAINTTLKLLIFNNNNIADEAATALADSLTSNKNMSLQYLGISGHAITSAGMMLLCKALATNTSVVVLWLGEVHEQDSVMAICNLLKSNTTLQELSMSLGNHGHFQEADISICTFCIFDALGHNTSLQSFYLTLGCETNAALWGAFARMLRHNVVLSHVHMSGNLWEGIPASCWFPVLDTLHDHPRHHSLCLEGGINLLHAINNCNEPNKIIYATYLSHADKEEHKKLLSQIHSAHADKLLAFLMAAHTRLGIDSIWTRLSNDCLLAVALCYFGLPLHYSKHENSQNYKNVLEVVWHTSYLM
jgi:hypothetical protein